MPNTYWLLYTLFVMVDAMYVYSSTRIVVVRYFFSIAFGKNTFSTCNSVIHLFSFLLDMYLKCVEFEDYFSFRKS